MPKKNPQKSHHEWMEIHLSTISQITKLERQKEDLLKENKELKEEMVKREDEVAVLKSQKKKLEQRVAHLEERAEKNEDANQFSASKTPNILITGDSHLKLISAERLATETGQNIEMVRTYCSRDYWPWAWRPEISIASVLLRKCNSRATHLLITSPTSDLTNLKQFSQSEQINWVDLSAKSIISTAEMCLIRFPALRDVTILEHLPRYHFIKALNHFQDLFMTNSFKKLNTRFDNKELQALRLQANSLLRREASVSLLRSQIRVVSSRLEPTCEAEEAQLFGKNGQRGHDGIHLRGPMGPKKLFETLSRIISTMQ